MADASNFDPASPEEQAFALHVKREAMALMLGHSGAEASLVIGGVLMAACELTARVLNSGAEEAKAQVIAIVSEFPNTKAH